MKIPGFDILEKVGEDGIASVWKAHQVSLNRIVAIKVLKPQFATNLDEVKDFIQEARSAAKLKHPNLIQVYDVAERDGMYYFVMEYVAGSTVGRILEKQGAIPQKQALRITRYVAEALEHAWNRSNIIHRNIKPDNIMIDEDGIVKLANLGSVKMVDSANLSAQLQRGKIEGTPNYVSPEQAKCTIQLNCKTDMYSLGATLYHMVTGKMPFAEDDPMEAMNKHVTGYLPNPRNINPSISLGVTQLITKLMMKDPRDRYKDWTEILGQIKKVASGRILLVKESVDAASTIEPLKTMATSMGDRQQAVASIPIWIRLPAWALLLTWWVFLVHHLLKTPSAPRLPKEPAGKPIVRETMHRKISPTRTKPVVPVQMAVQQEEQQIPEPAADDEKQELITLKEHIVMCLLQEEFDKAIALVKQELEYLHSQSFEAEMNNLKQLIGEIAEMNSLIESSFKDKLGQEALIHVNNKTYTIIPRTIVGNKISGDLVEKVGAATRTRQVTFAIPQLDPLERSRWLGKADTPSRNAMKFILYMKGRDYDSAKEYAGNSGPFSEIFTKELQSRQRQ